MRVDAGRGGGALSAGGDCLRDGREDLDFKLLPVCSCLSGFADEGRKAGEEGDVGAGDVPNVGEVSEASIVRDLRNGTGLGAMIGGDGDALLNCHRSRTEPLRGVSLSFSGVPGLEDDIWLEALTMFWTKPRPCKRLILGVGSLRGGALRNAGEAF